MKNEIKILFSETIIKKLLVKLTKEKRQRAQIITIRNEGHITTDLTDIKLRDYVNYMHIKLTT